MNERNWERKRSSEIPWKAVAAVLGVIAIAAIALFWILGGSAGQTDHPAPAPQPATPGSGVAPATTYGVSSKGIRYADVIIQPTMTIPVTGTWVHVQYMGAFNGSYRSGTDVRPVESSGDRLFAIENATGTLAAGIRKEDSGTKDLVVSIIKNGAILKRENSSAPFGTVNISAPA